MKFYTIFGVDIFTEFYMAILIFHNIMWMWF